MENIVTKIKQQIANNNILLFMKGSPEMPKCGFSAKAVELLTQYDKGFSYVDVLSHPQVRAELPKIANWPTFPQLWVKGELVGGSDIIAEMHETGELSKLLENIE